MAQIIFMKKFTSSVNILINAIKIHYRNKKILFNIKIIFSFEFLFAFGTSLFRKRLSQVKRLEGTRVFRNRNMR